MRLGLAGGGSDVSPYSDLYGGAILNATISMAAYTTIEPTDDNCVEFLAPDKGLREVYENATEVDTDGYFVLHKGVYNRIVRQFTHHPLSLRIASFVDAPAGSGLGTSSTLVVSILGAYVEWLKLPLGEYDIARLAYEIERVDLGLAGGKQDQYAATFGGFNYMEFNGDNVIVNPLRVRQQYIDELNHNLLLYWTDTSHVSADIIKEQQQNVKAGNSTSIESMHKVKEQSRQMKEALLKGPLNEIGEILNFGWQHKKQMAKSVSNARIDAIYEAAIKAGATGGKISGAGGGGFMFFYCPGLTRFAVREALSAFGGETKRYDFTAEGLKTWTIQ